jgi:hypothetical protein
MHLGTFWKATARGYTAKFARRDGPNATSSQTRPFQVLALKSVSVYQLTIWPFNYLNSAVLVAL